MTQSVKRLCDLEPEVERTAPTRRRICMVLPVHMSARTGGAQYQADRIALLIAERGGVDLYYLTGQAGVVPVAGGYHLLEVGRRGPRKFGYLFDAPRLLASLNEIGPELIYQRIGCAYTGISAFYAKRRGARFVWHVAHDAEVTPFDWKLTRNLPFRFAEKKVLEYGLRHADDVIVQSRRQADLLRKHYNREAAAVVPNAHPEPESPKIAKDKNVEVLWVANMKPWKRPELFVRLANELRDVKGVSFTMIGRPYRDRLLRERFDREVASTPNLRYLGEKTLSEVNARMSRAHVFVNTSTEEGFPNTFIQAWMRKVPVVSVSVDPDGVLCRNGIGYCAGTYDELCSAVRELATVDRKREEMGVRAQRYASEHHSLNALRTALMPFLS